MNRIEVGEQQNGQQIEIQQQDILRVSLSEVRTSGFHWTLRTSEQSAISLTADTTEAPAGITGGSGMHHWVFRAEKAGNAKIAFDYCRSWERAPARSFTISVHVT
jgi:predicted secreted protein